MEAINLTIGFINDSINDIKKNLGLYFFIWTILFLLENTDVFLSIIGIPSETGAGIFFMMLSGVFLFVAISFIIWKQKRNRTFGSLNFWYFVPSFLLYNLYYSLIFFFGLLLFIIPGVYFLIFYSMVPLVAVLDDHFKGSYFDQSKKLVRKNISLVSWVVLISFFLELSQLFFFALKEVWLKILVNSFYATTTLLMAMMMVKMYYYLKEEKEMI